MTRRFAAALWLVACSREPRRAAEPPLFGRHADADAGSVAKECAQVESVTPIPLERPIADVMGWQGAAWLDRPDRDSTDRPDEVVRALAIQPGAAVADVGAGTGYFTFRLAAAAGDAGSVLALDVQPEMLEKLHSKLEAHGTQNVTLVQTTPHDLRLHEATLDLALMVDVYHELAEPFVALATAAVRAAARWAPGVRRVPRRRSESRNQTRAQADGGEPAARGRARGIPLATHRRVPAAATLGGLREAVRCIRRSCPAGR